MDDQARYLWMAAHILPYEGEVRGWLRRHVRTLSAADVDDLLQEAYARLWPGDFTRILNGRSYLYTVIRNLLAEQARRARIIPMERMGEIEALTITSIESEPERRVSARQELARLQVIIASLPTQCRRAFELQKLQGFSQREIAKEMQISEKTVEKHLARALARVISALSEEESIEKGRPGRALGITGYDNDRQKD
jgi:RNA polymerase sigma factor (sigma-70 family)